MTTLSEIFDKLAARPAVRRKLPAGALLFRAGDPVTAVHIIAAGRLRLVRPSIAGRDVTLHRAGTGEGIAEPSLFSDRYHCDAVADTVSEVLAYQRAAILRGVREQPEYALELMRHFAGQIHAGRSRAEILTMRSAEERLMSYFRIRIPARSDTVELDQTWKQLASEIGITHEALYRALARLERDDLIERNGRRVRLTGR